jgi:2-aminoadipate transaminase
MKPPYSDMSQPSESWQITELSRNLKPSAIRELLNLATRPGMISFAGGLPAPELFPVEELKAAADMVFSTQGRSALQYSVTRGLLPLREAVAERESIGGIKSTHENISITSGAQQGIELMGRLFVNAGDYILTEYPTYVGALQVFNALGARYASVPMDNDGMIVSEAEALIKQFKPKMIYVVSTFQNPTGITMLMSRRNELVALAKKYNLPIIDDSPYDELRFSGEPLPSLKQLGEDSVIGLRTFSKILSPGIRVGWINASDDILKIAERIKQGSDLHTSSLNQLIVLEYLKTGKLFGHIQKICVDYLNKRNAMITRMKECFPAEVSWTEPEGGLFLWLTLPSHLSATTLLEKAIAENVLFVPGKPFYPDGQCDNTFRLNFSNASLSQIHEGIDRLGKAISAFC